MKQRKYYIGGFDVCVTIWLFLGYDEGKVVTLRKLRLILLQDDKRSYQGVVEPILGSVHNLIIYVLYNIFIPNLLSLIVIIYQEGK